MTNLRHHLIDARCKALCTMLMNGVRDFGPVWMNKDILNTCDILARDVKRCSCM